MGTPVASSQRRARRSFQATSLRRPVFISIWAHDRLEHFRALALSVLPPPYIQTFFSASLLLRPICVPFMQAQSGFQSLRALVLHRRMSRSIYTFPLLNPSCHSNKPQSPGPFLLFFCSIKALDFPEPGTSITINHGSNQSACHHMRSSGVSSAHVMEGKSKQELRKSSSYRVQVVLPLSGLGTNGPMFLVAVTATTTCKHAVMHQTIE